MNQMNKTKFLLFLMCLMASILTMMKAVSKERKGHGESVIAAVGPASDMPQDVPQKAKVCQFIEGYLIEGLNFEGSNILLPNSTEYNPIPAILLRIVRQPDSLTELAGLFHGLGFVEKSEEENFIRWRDKETLVASYVYQGDHYKEWCPSSDEDTEEPCIVEVVYKGPSLDISYDVTGDDYVLNRSQFYRNSGKLTAQVHFTYKGELTAQIYFNKTALDFSVCF